MLRLLGVLASMCLCVAPRWAAQCSDSFIRMNAEVARLDGYEEPSRHPEVYREGFKIVVSLSQAVPGRDVTVESIRMDHEFSPGRRAEFAQRKVLDIIYGAGPTVPRVFHVTLKGARADRARWVKEDSGIEAKSGNFLDTDDAAFRPFTFDTSQGPQLRGTVLAANAGVYELVFRIGYRSRGKRGECRTDPIRLYQDQDY